MEQQDYIKMDYSLETPEQRVEKVKEIIANTPSHKLKPAYLEKLSTYILDATITKETKKELMTDGRMVTVKDREISFEGLVGKLENGEDGIYNMIRNDKNIIFRHKDPITEEDIAEIPELAALRKEIDRLQEQFSHTRGKKAYALKQQIIQMCRDQYVIRAAYKKPVRAMNLIRSISKVDLSENITIDKNTYEVRSDGLVSFFNPKHISAILCNYARIKEDSWEALDSDIRWSLIDLENLIDATLEKKYPMYYDLLIYKIDGRSNAEIQSLLFEKYNIKHSLEYLSSLWRNKIPKLIAEEAAKQYLNWYYTKIEPGKWKTCSRCGQTKLACSYFFSKNKTSKDGYYSICKDCRNTKKE